MTQITKPKMGKELAEEIGIHIGDGSLGIYKKTGHYDYTISGGLEDKAYLLEFIVPLLHKLFHLKPYIQRHNKKKYFMLKYSSKQLVALKQNIGLPVGPKGNISIPIVVLESGFILDCLRGIFDTDGALLFKSRHRDENYYPVIKLFSKSKILVKQVDQLLKKEGIVANIRYSVTHHDKRGFSNVINEMYINGENNLNKFMRNISFSNIKHLTKYLIWKREGHLTPHTTLEERLKILSKSRCSSGVPDVSKIRLACKSATKQIDARSASVCSGEAHKGMSSECQMTRM